MTRRTCGKTWGKNKNKNKNWFYDATRHRGYKGIVIIWPATFETSLKQILADMENLETPEGKPKKMIYFDGDFGILLLYRRATK